MRELVRSWRSVWSTPVVLAPFGIATLANSGSEGHSNKMAAMRWAQTSNYGRWDNEALPNTFGAQVRPACLRPLLYALVTTLTTGIRPPSPQVYDHPHHRYTTSPSHGPTWAMATSATRTTRTR